MHVQVCFFPCLWNNNGNVCSFHIRIFFLSMSFVSFSFNNKIESAFKLKNFITFIWLLDIFFKTTYNLFDILYVDLWCTYSKVLCGIFFANDSWIDNLKLLRFFCLFIRLKKKYSVWTIGRLSFHIWYHWSRLESSNVQNDVR